MAPAPPTTPRAYHCKILTAEGLLLQSIDLSLPGGWTAVLNIITHALNAASLVAEGPASAPAARPNEELD
jgi:hypothetical protein